MGVTEPYNLYRKLLKNNKVFCSECSEYNSNENKYCIHCGHKLQKIDEKNKLYNIYCTKCGERLSKEDKFCGNCGSKVTKIKNEEVVCPVCGEWCDDSRYCWNCGHDKIGKTSVMKTYQHCKGRSIVKDLFRIQSLKEVCDSLLSKKCPNCDMKHQVYFNYCEKCGTKLIKPVSRWDRWFNEI